MKTKKMTEIENHVRVALINAQKEVIGSMLEKSDCLDKVQLEMENLVKTAQREVLNEVITNLIGRSNKFNKVLFSTMYDDIHCGAYGERFKRLSDAWHKALRKSKTLLDIAGDIIEMKKRYY